MAETHSVYLRSLVRAWEKQKETRDMDRLPGGGGGHASLQADPAFVRDFWGEEEPGRAFVMNIRRSLSLHRMIHETSQGFLAS